MATKRYRVTMKVQFPAWDEVDGFTTEVNARDRAEAIKFARREFWDAGHIDRTKGKLRFTAKALDPAAEEL